MHIVGTDRITVVAGLAHPSGVRHAIDLDGRTECLPRATVYRFPATAWSDDDTDACTDCRDMLSGQLALSQLDAYPDDVDPTRAGAWVNLLIPQA